MLAICHGSTIVVLRDDTQIVVASDSMGFSPTMPKSLSLCKIVRANDVFIASAGFVEDRPTGFSVMSIGIKEFSRKGSILERAMIFKKAITKPFTRAVTRIKHDTPTVFAEEILGKPQSLEVVFVGIENGVPTFVFQYFSVVQESGHIFIRAAIRRCPGDICSHGSGYLLMGEIKAAETIISHGGFWTFALVRDARRIIEIEIADKPKDVAAPIDILQISRNGTVWIQRKQQCPE